MMTHYDVEFKLSNCQIIPHPPPPQTKKKAFMWNDRFILRLTVFQKYIFLSMVAT